MDRKCLILFLILLPVLAFGQSAADMDALLTAQTVSASKAARFVMGAAGYLSPELSGYEAERAAYEIAADKGWIKVDAFDDITMKDAAFLIMSALELKGGVMYSLFKNSRYAYREMVYQRLITGQRDQDMVLSGFKFLLILDNSLIYATEE